MDTTGENSPVCFAMMSVDSEVEYLGCPLRDHLNIDTTFSEHMERLKILSDAWRVVLV